MTTPRLTRPWAPCLLAAALLLAPCAASAQALPASAEWRAARWGMTLDQILAAFPGEAKKLDAAIRLADGNVVAAGIDRVVVGATGFRVRFVLDPVGKLALVSLRTPETVEAKPEEYAAVEAALVARLGPPTETASDKEFVEQRQTTWKLPTGRVDLKSIPGVLVILHAAPSQQPPQAAPAPRVEQR